MKTMPIGLDDFKTVKEKYYYVDKTPFIKEFLDNHAQVTLITRPRRFGKTMLMSMLYYFFSVEETNKNTDGSKENNINQLFDDLAINHKENSSYKEKQNTYPVIFLTLKGVQNDNWKMLYGAFTLLITKEYNKHRYLLEKNILTETEKSYYQRILNGSATPEEYQVSIQYLSEFLEKYYDEKVIILIDEYDAPLQCAYDHGFYDTAIGYFKTWFNNILKGNTALEFAVLTGVLRIAKESIFSGLNNLEVNTVTQNKYREAFGFTSEEISKICKDFKLDEKIPELKKWYDGYKFGELEIYNPWSVTNFIQNGGIPKPYWVNTAANEIIKHLLSRVNVQKIKILQKLMDGESVSVTLNEGVIYNDIDKDRSALMTLLLMTGYLTVNKRGNTYNRYELKIPNEEIKQVYINEVLNHLLPDIEKNDFDDMFDALFRGDKKTFEEELQTIIEKSVSVFDDTSRECFYHGFMLGMTTCFHPNGYNVESNGESGDGRFDIAIIPKNTQKPGVIMELKRAETENELPRKAANALKQIQDKKYAQRQRQNKITTIFGYGIAFYKKKVHVESKQL